MDLLGWSLLGILFAAMVAAWGWGRAAARRRAAAARQWASEVGLNELRSGEEGVPGDLKVGRLRTMPSFKGTLDGREVSVIATRTRVRLGELWVFCTHAQRPALFLGNIVGFSGANVFGNAVPSSWTRVKAGGELDRHFFVSVAEAGTEPVLSDDARAALTDASVHAWCFNVNPSGFTVLWFKQSYGQDTRDALTQAARLLSRLLDGAA